MVGTNASGTASLQNNANGILLQDQSSTQVIENLSSGNNFAGIYVTPLSGSIEIRRNRVGTNAAGTGALANVGGGIQIFDVYHLEENIVDLDIAENLVAFNDCFQCSGGIAIGTSNAANTVSGIRLSANRVYANTGLEIDLAPPSGLPNGVIYGVTANDTDDPDSGPNALQNFPVLTYAAANGTNVSIEFTLNSIPSRAYTVEFFHTTSCDASGHGGAHTYLGNKLVNTNGFGDAADSVVLALASTSGLITATATHEDDGTSEFSACFALPSASGVVFEDGFEGS